LPRPLVIPKVMTLKTLADVRQLLRHLPDGYHERSPWRHVARELLAAANGHDVADSAHVAIALRMVLSMEGVECRPR
jgi:hypothetical protein